MLRGIGVIAGNDFRILLRSPLGWCTLALYQLLLGMAFFIVLQEFVPVQAMLAAAESSSGLTAVVVSGTTRPACLLLLVVTPLLSMGCFAGERRQGSFALLMSSPVSMTALVLGKYLGLLAFMLLAVALAALMLISLRLGGHLDMGLLAACVLALCLVAATFAAAGVYVSSLCHSPASAALGCLALLVVLWNVDTGAGPADSASAQVLSYLSLSRHTDALRRGIFSSADLAYFALSVMTFLALALRRLDAQRNAA